MRFLLSILLVLFAHSPSMAIGCDPADISVATTPIPPQTAASLRRHWSIMASLPVRADAVAIGDSLVQAWPEALLREALDVQSVVNLGLGADKTQNVLWRLSQGNLPALRPRRVLLLIGTNNLFGHNAPCAITAGIRAILDRVHALWGTPEILVIEVPPRERFEQERQELNADIRGLGVKTINVDAALTAESYRPDHLHFTAEAYQSITRILRRGR